MPTCTLCWLPVYSFLTGFGYDIAKRLDNVGFTVFAGCLQEDSYGAKQLKKSCSEQMHIVPLDVTSDESIRKAVTHIQTNLPEKGNANIVLFGDYLLALSRVGLWFCQEAPEG